MFGVAGARLIGKDVTVGDGGVAFVDDEGDVEDCFVGGLVQGRKCAASVGSFKLGDGVTTAGSLAQVEAAKLVVEDASEADVDVGESCGNRSGHGERDHFVFFVGGDGGFLGDAVGLDGDFFEGDFGGIQNDGGGRCTKADVNGFVAGESGGGEIGFKGEVVTLRGGVFWKALRVSGEAEERAADCRDHKSFHYYLSLSDWRRLTR